VLAPAFCIVGAFAIGSIPFGFLIARARGIDIRQHGSKNIGATNVGRVLGRPWGILCFALDFLKGLAPVLVTGFILGMWDAAGPASSAAAAASQPVLERVLSAQPIHAWTWLAVAVAAIAGHMFTPWLGFKGGKGVATGFGALAGVWPVLTIPALAALILWMVSVKITRYVGISSCLAAASLPISVALLLPLTRALNGDSSPGSSISPGEVWPSAGWPVLPYFLTVTALAAVVIFKHRANIARTLAGTESKVGAPKKPA